MFIISVRASRVKFFAVLGLVVVLSLGFLLLGGSDAVAAMSDGVPEYRYSGIKTAEDRAAFFAQFGIEVEGEGECEAFTMPENFDRVMLGYNEIQKEQGLDIAKYAKKKVERYTYSVKNAPEGAEPLNVTVLVYRHRVIAGDITCLGDVKFVKPLTSFSSLAENRESAEP